MAVAPSSSPGTLDPKPDNSDPEVPSTLPPPASTPSTASPAPPAENPNPNPNPSVATPLPPSVPSFAPSFHPMAVSTAPQYSILPNPGLPNPYFSMNQSLGLQPPGINAPGVSFRLPGTASGAGSVTVSVPPGRPGGMYSFTPGQPPVAAPLAYGQVPMGYMTVPGAPPQGPPAMPPFASPFGSW